MSKRKQKVFTVLVAVFGVVQADAQSHPCAYWPAPCPHASSIRAARDWAVGRRNNRLPQEMEFDASLRAETDKIVQHIANENNWQVYEFNESNLTAPLAANERNIVDTVPYAKRPPQMYHISYIFITDRQALDSWRDWCADLKKKWAEAVSGASKPMPADNRRNAYMDSAMYYTQLRMKYVQDHQQTYMNDLRSDNKSGLKQYNEQLTAFQKKSDLYIEKVQKMQVEANAGPQQVMKMMEDEERDQNVSYRDKCVMLVAFDFNNYQEGSGIIDPTNYKCILPQKRLLVNGVQFAGVTHNPLTLDRLSTGENGIYAHDYDLAHPTSVGLLLVAGWKLQPEPTYQFYHALYQQNAANVGYKTVKSVPCDRLRSIAVQVEGRDDKVEALMQQLNLETLKAQVIR